MPNLRCLAGSACLLVSCAAAAPPAPTPQTLPVTRYTCKLVDGSVVVLPLGLLLPFDDVAMRCGAFEAPGARPQPLPVRPLPPRAEEPPTITANSSDWVTLFAIRANRDRATPHPAPYAVLIREAAERYRVDPRLVAAVIDVESGARPTVRSPKGAIGLMQLMPATAQRYGVRDARRLLDPAVNIDVGTRYLSDLLSLFEGSVELALAGYNAGETAVLRHRNRVPPYPETQEYVQRVLALLP